MTCNHQAILNSSPHPLFIVLSGPSGAGKDAVLNRMKKSGLPIKYITTLTTRPKRPQEVPDRDYHFVSLEQFQEMISRKELLEWANVYGNYYGVPKQPIREALKEGQDIIVKTDIQGAATIKKILPQALFIFIVPPSLEELSARLTERRTESPSDLALRLAKATEEIKQIPMFDYVVINQQNEVDRAVSDIGHIIRAEKCRVNHREITLSQLEN